MKLLILLGLATLIFGAPAPTPDDDDNGDDGNGDDDSGDSGVVAVAHAGIAVPGRTVYTPGTYFYHAGENGDDGNGDDDNGDSGVVAVAHAGTAVPGRTVYTPGTYFYHAGIPQIGVQHVVSPAAVEFRTYEAPVPTTYGVMQQHAVAPPAVIPAVTTYAAAGPAPVVGTPVATVERVQQAVVAPVPTTYTALAPTFKTVALPPQEVNIPVQKTEVEIPINHKVEYGFENYVAGSTTAIHKPSLSAPAIAPPALLKSQVIHAAPEVKVKHQDVVVHQERQQFVEAPYDAGTIVQYTAPEFKQVKVPTPVSVPQPIAVAQPVLQPVVQAVPQFLSGTHIIGAAETAAVPAPSTYSIAQPIATVADTTTTGVMAFAPPATVFSGFNLPSTFIQNPWAPGVFTTASHVHQTPTAEASKQTPEVIAA